LRKWSSPQKKHEPETDESQAPSVPTIDDHSCVDDPQFMDLQQLVDSAVIFAGTDYGFHTMSVTVPVTKERYDFHEGLHKSPGSLVPWHTFLQLPPAHKIDSGDLGQKTMTTYFQRSLQQRKRNTVWLKLVIW
jgi:hypothetical protein